MRHVYIVTSGCYSDYSIRAVFTRREDAEAVVAEWKKGTHYNYDPPEIEEWPIDAEVSPDKHHRRIYVVLDEHGDEITGRHEPGDDRVSWWRWSEVSTYPRPESPKHLEFSGVVWARDADHAIKMGRDARAASIAAGDLDRLRARDPEAFRSVPATHPECRDHADCREDFALGQACAGTSTARHERFP
jgi:hypothetical protein